MLELALPVAKRRTRHILCLGAHCDDIEIGCGGTLLKWLASSACDVTWAVFSSSSVRGRELHSSAGRFLRHAAAKRIVTHAFRESFFPAHYTAIKEAFNALKELPAPDIVFTHRRGDRHQDHGLLAELTWNAFRDHLILEYEIPKYEGDLVTPNAFVQLTRAQAASKTRALLACYGSQRPKPWFNAGTFDGLMRLRGVEAGPGTGWAEGFQMNKVNLL